VGEVSQKHNLNLRTTLNHLILGYQDLLIPSLLSKGSSFSASELAMVPGTPIPPMLAR
jgi:DNA ligase 1